MAEPQRGRIISSVPSAELTTCLPEQRRHTVSSKPPSPSLRAISPPAQNTDMDTEMASDVESPRSHTSPPLDAIATSLTLTDLKEPGQHDTSKADKKGAKEPALKRRRVTRACDECRKKKIKCDGRQPCLHCSAYNYECTYDKPSQRGRASSSQCEEALKYKLARAEAILQALFPNISLDDLYLDQAVQRKQQEREDSARSQARDGRDITQTLAGMAVPSQHDTELTSMIRSIGQLDWNESGEWDFHGASSGAVFLRRMKEHFGGLMAHDHRTPFLPLARIDSHNTDEATLPIASCEADRLSMCKLPPKQYAARLCYYALNYATCLLRIVHTPSFEQQFDRLYTVPTEEYSSEDYRFLALFYAVLALGCMYDISESDPTNPNTYIAAMDEGFKYYAAAKNLLQDITECRDLASLQALLFMIQFLQATSNLSGCYAFIGVALRSVLRMGLHRHLPHTKITAVEDETRRRVFHVTRQMDTYVSTILGFPLLLRDEDVDQPLPTEVDDKYITKDGIVTPPAGAPPSVFEAFNAHARLIDILSKVVKHVYPLRGIADCGVNRESATYTVTYAQIREIEHDLQTWYEQLPTRWRLSSNGPAELLRIQTVLRFMYAQVQMMLYQPFLHYASPRLSAGKVVDERSYACAAAAIRVSQNIVHMGNEMEKHGFLIGPYWFILYTQFFATLSLVFYHFENPDNPASSKILLDAMSSRDDITNSAKLSVAAERLSNVLDALFDKLPNKFERIETQQPPPSKRSLNRSTGETSQWPSNLSRPSSSRKTQSGATVVSQGYHGYGSGQARSTQSRNVAIDPRHGGHQPGRDLQPDLHGFMPLDLSPAVAANNSIALSIPYRQPLSNVALDLGGAATNDLGRLDAMMFPSEDPFAYPRQPLIALTGLDIQEHRDIATDLRPDSMEFSMPNVFEGIQSQLLEIPTAFPTPPSGRQPGWHPATKLNGGPFPGSLGDQLFGNSASLPIGDASNPSWDLLF